MRLKIYGVRGSYPPTNSQHSKIGINTTCLRLDIGKHLVIIDAGTGIINLGHDLIREWKSEENKQDIFKIHLFFTHGHIDHIMGFPYFNLIYFPQAEFHIISPPFLNYSIKDILESLMSPVVFPVTFAELPARFNFHPIGESRQAYFYEEDFQIFHVSEPNIPSGWLGRISCIRNFTHPKGGSYIYKFESNQGKSLVFATDIEGFVNGDKRLAQFARNAQVLIHDAQYSWSEYEMFQGFGHSTYEMACEVAKQAEVEKLLLFHHDPKHSDEELFELEKKSRQLFKESYLATEDMEFEF